MCIERVEEMMIEKVSMCKKCIGGVCKRVEMSNYDEDILYDGVWTEF